MSEEQPSFWEIVREQLRMNLSDISYERFFQLLSEMRCRLLAPNLFREKMKFLFKQHCGLLMIMNPLLPDEYRFTDEELQEDARDYQELEKFEASIEFVNELTKQVDSSEDLGNFYELVTSHKRKEMDDAEFYGSAFKFMRGDFHLMKKLGNVLNYETTPSYIKLPMMIGGLGDDDQVLNNRFSIYSNKVCTSTQTDKVDDQYYIYSPDEVIKLSRGRPHMEKRTSVEERKCEAVAWWESRRTELELVLRMLTVAEEEMERALGKMASGKWLVNAKLREYLVENGVKVKMLEMMKFGELEKLPLDSLPGVVNQLSLKKAEVVEAMRHLNLMRLRKKINC